jgi:hypothetical protein
MQRLSTAYRGSAASHGDEPLRDRRRGVRG